MKQSTCTECGGWNGSHFGFCPETPDNEEQDEPMETKINDLIDSGWGHEEIMREAELRGWDLQEAAAIATRELGGAQ